eukprot:scaffold127114_cov90-Cyclotella_meneghiniana.AAC.1
MLLPHPVVTPSNVLLTHLQRLLYVLCQLVIHRTKIVSTIKESVNGSGTLTQDPSTAAYDMAAATRLLYDSRGRYGSSHRPMQGGAIVKR